MVWVNGEKRNWLSVNDRAVQFGDGCFTTARIRAGCVDWLEQHVCRLQQDAARLMIKDVDWVALKQEMIMAAAWQGEGVVKAIITRGEGGRGYSVVDCRMPARMISVAPYPMHYHCLRENGVRLVVSPIPLAQNPLLAGIKHLNRLEQVLIRARLEQTDADETLVLDTTGKLVECAAANLFWRCGQQVFTPLLIQSGVKGVMRQHIIGLLKKWGYSCQEVSAEIEVLSQADEVLICNALMPIFSVYQIDEWHYVSRQLFDIIISYC